MAAEQTRDLLEERDAWRGVLDVLARLRDACRAGEERGMAAAVTSEGSRGEEVSIPNVLFLRVHDLAALVWIVLFNTLLYHCSVTHYTVADTSLGWTTSRSKCNSPATP